MKRWNTWEEETKTLDYQLSNGNFAQSIFQFSTTRARIILIARCFHIVMFSLCLIFKSNYLLRLSFGDNSFKSNADPRRFKLPRQTSFGERHLKVWSNHHVILWIVS